MANPILTKEFEGSVTAADVALQGTEVPRAAGPAMTKNSVLFATVTLLALVILGASWGWNNPLVVQRWWWLWIIGMLAVVIVTVAKPQLARITGVIYALGQGVLLGSVSRIYEEFFEGIVFLAILATFSVFAVMLLLYATRVIKVTEKTRSVIVMATVGVLFFYLVNWIISLFTGNLPSVFGLGTAALVVSVIVVVIAALNLLLDFDLIERGIASGAPKSFSWFAAFGLMVTMIWLYLEILRLLAIIASRR